VARCKRDLICCYPNGEQTNSDNKAMVPSPGGVAARRRMRADEVGAVPVVRRRSPNRADRATIRSLRMDVFWRPAVNPRAGSGDPRTTGNAVRQAGRLPYNPTSSNIPAA
jgi:hypothetical protein